MQNFRALGAPPPHPRASGGWGLCPQTPSLRRLGASPPDPHWPPAAGGSAPRPPKQPPPLPISGYAPGCNEVISCLHHYIKAKVPRVVKNLDLFCDGCRGQNHNNAMVRFLFTLVFRGDFEKITLHLPV